MTTCSQAVAAGQREGGVGSAALWVCCGENRLVWSSAMRRSGALLVGKQLNSRQSRQGGNSQEIHLSAKCVPEAASHSEVGQQGSTGLAYCHSSIFQLPRPQCSAQLELT